MKDKTFKGIVIGLLSIVILLLVLIKFPIEINIVKTDCPEIRCQETICNCRIEIVNETIENIRFEDYRPDYWGDIKSFNHTWHYYNLTEDWYGNNFINTSYIFEKSIIMWER